MINFRHVSILLVLSGVSLTSAKLAAQPRAYPPPGYAPPASGTTGTNGTFVGRPPYTGPGKEYNGTLTWTKPPNCPIGDVYQGECATAHQRRKTTGTCNCPEGYKAVYATESVLLGCAWKRGDPLPGNPRPVTNQWGTCTNKETPLPAGCTCEKTKN